MNTFCTIITAEYIPFAKALSRSIRRYNPTMELHVLIVDGEKELKIVDRAGIRIVEVEEVLSSEIAQLLYRKYSHLNTDQLRWSLKPVLISHLLNRDYEKVVFVDCDIFFFDNYDFLFDELDRNAMILTPHWYTPWPLKNREAFVQMLTTGVFNAGFIGASRQGLAPLGWWAEACHFMMGHDEKHTVHDDQKYLDYIPLLFDGIKIIEHKGCNLMAGNYEECKRELVDDKVLIDGKYPIVFVHFNTPLIRQILMGYDPLLKPYFELYKKEFESGGVSIKDFLRENEELLHPSVFQRLKWRLHLRTRVKKFVYKLAQKL